MNSTDETVTGIPQIPNDFVAEAVAEHPDVFLGFGIVDPWQGEIARREIRRIKELGLHGIGRARASLSYLNQQAILAAALGTGCDAIHPGYGFLSEDPQFAAACEDKELEQQPNGQWR